MNDAPIPPDIRKAAEAVVERGYNEGLVDAVCRALMAEREKAAKIAEQWTESSWIDEVFAAKSIADSIRRGSS